MTPPLDPRDPATLRTLDPGRCHLYVMTCASEDLLKLGFSRDPLQRMQSLHRRWYEFFDVEHSWLVATDTVREARALETRLRRELADHNAPAPLTIRQEAGGHREWYRGASSALQEAMRALSAAGHELHAPATPWFRHALLRRADLLHEWTDALLAPDELAWVGRPTLVQSAVRDALDAYRAFGIPLEGRLPPRVVEWYARTAQ